MPIKQGASVFIVLFGGWVVVLLLGGLYVLLAQVLTPELYLLAASVLLLAVSGLLLRWIRTRGARIFENL